jgi:hypothetical protein
LNNGFIKLFRCIEDSFFWNDSQAVHLWIQLLLSANHRDKEMLLSGEKVIIKSGHFVCSRNTLSLKTGINESKVHRILKVFESEQMIEQQMNSKFRMISISNWNKYQGSEQVNEQQMNSRRTADEQQMNTNNNDKNEKNDKNKEKDTIVSKKKVESKNSFGVKGLVKMTDAEYQKLCNTYGKTETDNKIIDFEACKEFGKYKDHYLTVNKWLRKDVKPTESQPQKQMKVVFSDDPDNIGYRNEK